MLTRNDILLECINRCITEMYKYAQPSLDFQDILEKAKNGEFKDDEKCPLYSQHYLSQKNFLFIRQHYLDCYGLFDWWEDSMDTLLDKLEKGGNKKVYRERVGNTPGYKDYEPVPPLKEIIGEKYANKTIDLIKGYKKFFSFGCREVNYVNMSISLGCSPCSNKQTVIDYWKSQEVDIQIKDISVENIYYGDDDNE